MRGRVQFERTNLLSQMFNQWGGLPASLFPHMDQKQSVYGYVGTEDFTLFPLFRPGSFVQIDPGQRRVDRSGRSKEFHRPRHFQTKHRWKFFPYVGSPPSTNLQMVGLMPLAITRTSTSFSCDCGTARSRLRNAPIASVMIQVLKVCTVLSE